MQTKKPKNCAHWAGCSIVFFVLDDALELLKTPITKLQNKKINFYIFYNYSYRR